jgi:hypothetical protein
MIRGEVYENVARGRSDALRTGIGAIQLTQKVLRSTLYVCALVHSHEIAARLSMEVCKGDGDLPYAIYSYHPFTV